LAYLFLILLSFVNQLPPSQLFGRFILVNNDVRYCNINILPRDFPNSDIYQILQKLHNNSTAPTEPKELGEEPKVEVVFSESAIQEYEAWLPDLYSYIPDCNKEGKCTAIILKFTPEQLQIDDGKVYEYIYRKELGESKAISHVEEAIMKNGDKLIIATSDEETILREFYRAFAENKSKVLGVACGLGVLYGLILSFFGKKILNPILFVVGFAVTALVVNFMVYPARLSEYYLGEGINANSLLNVALVLGSGLSAGILAVKAQKIGVCLFFIAVGAALSIYVYFLALVDIGLVFWVIFFLLVAGTLYRLIRAVLNNYQSAAAFATSLFGGILVPVSIYLYFALDVSEQGFDVKPITSRNRMLLFWVGVFLVVYGTKVQLGIKRKRKGVQGPQGKVYRPGMYQVLPKEKEVRKGETSAARTAVEQKFKNKAPKNMKSKKAK